MNNHKTNINIMNINKMNNKKVTFLDKPKIYYIEKYDNFIEREKAPKLKNDIFIDNIQIIIKKKNLLKFLKKIKIFDDVINLLIVVTFGYFDEIISENIFIKKNNFSNHIIKIPINKLWDKKYSRIHVDVNIVIKQEIKFEITNFICSGLSVINYCDECDEVLFCHEFFDAQEILLNANKFKVRDFFTNSDFILCFL